MFFVRLIYLDQCRSEPMHAAALSYVTTPIHRWRRLTFRSGAFNNGPTNRANDESPVCWVLHRLSTTWPRRRRRLNVTTGNRPWRHSSVIGSGILAVGVAWRAWGIRTMLIEFDQTTMADMTAALEHVCDKLPADKDTHENRKRIADAMIAYGQSGRRTLSEFQSFGSKTLVEITRSSRAGRSDHSPPHPC